MGSALRERLGSVGVEADKELIGKLGRFAELLWEWNATHNLTGDDRLEAIVENFVDSLVPTTFVEEPVSLLDVGTGAGFPGLILAAAWPEVPVTLCEPRNKRAAFLRLAALELGLGNVVVERKRVEELKTGPYDLISSRAVSDTALLLKLTEKVRNERSRLLLYKGSRLDDEMEALPEEWEVRIIERPPRRYLYLLPKA
ncbi:16S rRNA (guanine(527)-N(7))-methyltransferase RsmG [Nitratifractor sp.]